MWRIVRWIASGLATGLALVAFLLAGAMIALNLRAGRQQIERRLPQLTDGIVSISGISGRFPDSLRIARIEISDPRGTWLAIDQFVLDWSPSRLLNGLALIDRLEAAQVALARLPDYPSDTEESPFALPVRVAFKKLSVERAVLGEPVLGRSAVLAVDGEATLASLEEGDMNLAIRRLDSQGTYRLKGGISPAQLRANLIVQEPERGLLASLAGLPELGTLSGNLSLEGPWSSAKAKLMLTAGPLRAAAQGTLNLEKNSGDVAVTASAPAMSLRPDLSWQGLSLNAKLRGPFTKPRLVGTLRVEDLRAAGAVVRHIAADLDGDAGRVQLGAEFAGLAIPGPKPDLFQNEPVILQASARLDIPRRPVTFTLKHPLVVGEGKLDTAGDMRGDIFLHLPKLAPLGAIGGFDVQGATELKVRALQKGNATRLDIDGKLGIIGGEAPLPALVGNAAKIAASATVKGPEITISRLQFDGKTITLSADGRLAKSGADLNWKLGLSDLAALAADVAGQLYLAGKLSGPQGNLALTASLSGALAAKGLKGGPIAAKLDVHGLPSAPSGQMTAQGILDGSPVGLSLTAGQGTAGALLVTIERADWKSAHASGTVMLPSPLPLGKLELRIGRLEDLQQLVGQPLSGTAAMTVETLQRGSSRQMHLQVDGRGVGFAGIDSVGHLTLTTAVNDPITHPVINGQLFLEDISTGTIRRGSARLDFAGPEDAISLRLSAKLPEVLNAEARLMAVAAVDLRAKRLDLSSLETLWKGEKLRLLSPTQIGFADGMTLHRLRLGLRQGILEAHGQIDPTLNLDLQVRDLPADIAGIIVPELALDGKLRGDARLTGDPSQPHGTITLELAGLHARSGNMRVLPPVDLSGNVQLAGGTARIDSRLTAGPNARLTLFGEAPLDPSQSLDLRAEGLVDLKMLDPVLTAQGQRARGRITLNAGIGGMLSDPRISGSLQLAGGELQDYGLGARISDVTALLEAENDTLRIDRLEARAGQGRITVKGNIGVLKPNLPVELTLTARNARPLSSDRLTVTLDSNVTVKGEAHQQLTAAGTINIRRAEIRIPERIPARIAVLDVREPGAPPPPLPKPGRDLGIDLTLEAQREIFVRGRGLDAELGGKIHLRGTANNPQPDGSFAMRHGQYTLAGKTFTFRKGEVGFDGGTLTNPTLDFVANTTSGNITATLAVSGTANKPRITLSSSPDLPQDEVLAQLLFGRSSNTLSPFELAQIAGALASLTGVTSGIGNPLESVRKGLGLDRLSVGSAKGGGPTLEAGRYVAPGVYVGARQGFTGTAIPQAAVQLDVTEGLKLEGTVGAGSPSSTSTGTSSVGVIYQFEY